jgi:cytochrome bd-type quinol oxidase subunit 1
MVVLHNNANRDFMHLIWKIYYYELVTGKEKDIHVSHKGQGVATNREKGQGVTRTRVGATPNKNGLARTLPILQFSLLWNLIWVFIYTKLKLRFVCIILVMCLWFLTDSVHKYRCGTFMTVMTTGSIFCCIIINFGWNIHKKGRQQHLGYDGGLVSITQSCSQI